MFILACSSRKQQGQWEARMLYMGNSLASPIKYANQQFGNNWYILSAKYGVIKCDTIISDYNVTFTDKSTKPVTPQQINQKFPDPKTVVELIAGKEYIKMLQEAWPESTIKNLFLDYGIMYQGMWRRALKDAEKNNTNIHTWLQQNKQKYIPKKLTDDEVKQWMKENYYLDKSCIKLAHIFRNKGYSCDEHRWERLYKEVEPPLNNTINKFFAF